LHIAVLVPAGGKEQNRQRTDRRKKKTKKPPPPHKKRQMNLGDKNSTKNVGYSCQHALKLIAGLNVFES